MRSPAVSVIMPVFNGGEFLKESIDSILRQSFKDFEFIIINDGSVDNSLSIIKSTRDKRVRVINHSRNLGIVASLNQGIKAAKGELIARMDADDISLPNRLLIQVKFLKNNPDVGVCGTYAINTKSGKLIKDYTRNDQLKAKLFFNSPFVHSSVLFRKSLLIENNLSYLESYRYAEDYKLWSQLAQFTNFAVIPKVLLKYRDHAENSSKTFMIKQRFAVKKIHSDLFLEQRINLNLNEKEVFEKISIFSLNTNIEKVLSCLENIESQLPNNKVSIISEISFRKIFYIIKLSKNYPNLLRLISDQFTSGGILRIISIRLINFFPFDY